MKEERKLTDVQKMHQQEMKKRREAVKQRKARTHRLIIRGAIAEKVILNAESMTDEQFQQALYQAIGKDDIVTSCPENLCGGISQKNPSEDTS